MDGPETCSISCMWVSVPSGVFFSVFLPAGNSTLLLELPQYIVATLMVGIVRSPDLRIRTAFMRMLSVWTPNPWAKLAPNLPTLRRFGQPRSNHVSSSAIASPSSSLSVVVVVEQPMALMRR
ncbi:hypothetical protein QBC44DRAFT_109937 [Cladorrhinum sp. PSN332]|nr:hypothetical protein QBC44DRAFT_109937 [Cladorrhinum sp. PSN332]